MDSSCNQETTAERSICLQNLPVELRQAVCAELTTQDVKNLRLTCKAFQDAFLLPLRRVFLSPNSRNIQVFQDIARHDTFRHQIVEIIYDDARFRPSFDEAAKQWGEEDPDAWIDDTYDSYEFPSLKVPYHYRMAFCKLADSLWHWRPQDVKRPYHLAREALFEELLSLQRSYEIYQQLLHDEDRVVDANADAETLRYGLSRFPNLRRITLTPAAHGLDFRPLYQTPMIRSLPYGFIYPIPDGWPQPETDRPLPSPPVTGPWENEEEKDRWRGFGIVTRALAQSIQENQVGPVTELVVDTNHLWTGLSWAIFDQPNEEYNNLLSILRQPGFSRLELSLLIGEQDIDNWHTLRADLLRQALIQAPDLERFSISTNFNGWHGFDLGAFIRLSTIFPIENWARLRHFGLSRFPVEHSDLLDLLAALPPTLRSIELSQLHFCYSGGTYKQLFEAVRNQLGWRERPTALKPRISVRLDPPRPIGPTIICLDREIEDYVYGEGPNPFEDNSSPFNPVTLGFGTEIDLCEPGHERPFVAAEKLAELGYVKRAPVLLDYQQQLRMLEEQ